MSLYLVTGGAGFIGSNITHELVKREENVRVVDNFATGKKQNIDDIINDIEFIKADIRDLNAMEKATRDVDFVLHQAALPSVARSISDPITSNEVNIDGTLNMLVAARDNGVKRFVLAASSSAYGNVAESPKKEDMTTFPLSPYALNKLMCENYCRIFHDLYGLNTISLRYFNVFGPGQDPLSQYSAAIPKFITSILDGMPITIYGDGKQSRDFTYIQNVVHANLLACQSPNSAGEVINIACGCELTINEVVQYIQEKTGIKAKIIYEEPRAGDVMHSCADISKARELLGYEPLVSFRDGLSKTIEWLSNGYKNGHKSEAYMESVVGD